MPLDATLGRLLAALNNGIAFKTSGVVCLLTFLICSPSLTE